jgi:uncharacterized Tic20 family protein
MAMNTPSDQIPPHGPPAASTPSSPPPESPAMEIDPQARQWGMFAHLSALLGGLITTGWAGSLGCFIGPLIIWLAKKETMPFVDDQGKEALNFNLTIAIVFFLLLLLSIATFGIGLLIAIPGWFIVGIYWLVMTIVASIKANEGVAYRYPFCLRLIK